ncbi:MAG: hypothetical protein GX410_10995 [Elusimicrobia bacterium]|nr:hypothetical protein [Elusimicrobiota bacterium]
MKKTRKQAKTAPSKNRRTAPAKKTPARTKKALPAVTDADFENEYDQAYDPHKFGI